MGLSDGRDITAARSGTTLSTADKFAAKAKAKASKKIAAAKSTYGSTDPARAQSIISSTISQAAPIVSNLQNSGSQVVLPAAEAARLQDLAAQRRAAVVASLSQSAGSTTATPPPATAGGLGQRVTDDSNLGRTTEQPGSPQIEGLNAAEIEAALSALEAKYGLTREQLLADQTEIGATYRFLAANLQKARSQALQGVDQDALARGVLRSGIAVQNRAEVSNDFAQREAQAEQEKAQRLRAINNALSSLGSNLASDKAATAQGIGQEQLASQERLAAILRLSQGSGYSDRDQASGRTDIDPTTGASFLPGSRYY